MKKALKIIGIIVVVIFLLLLILPFAFKGKIVELIKSEANKNIKAEVNFSDVDLSLIRNFPNLSVSIDDLSVIGVEPFAGDTLAYMQALNLTLDVMSVIKGDQIQIKKIQLNKPNINVLVLEDGRANYDIALESEEEDEPEETESGESIDLSIDQYEIKDGRIVYNDATFPMLLSLQGLNHSGKGNFAEEVFTLYTKTKIDKTIVDYDGIRYIAGASAELDADIAMDLPNMKFTFMENELRLNQLALGFDGWLAMPADDIDMDISFDAKKNDLKTLLSLIPAEFAQDIEGVNADGKVSLSGFVKGVYNDNSMPGFGLNLGVENGRVQYPDLPRSIENIQILADIKSPEGSDMDGMTIDVPKFHMEIGKSANDPNTIDARLSLRNPMTDPLIDTKVDADLNLGSFKDVIPMDAEFDLRGMLNAHFELKGALSSIENQQFDKFMASGGASLVNFAYADADIAAEVPEARLTITPQQLTLETLKVIYDGIDMSLDGYMNNYVAYALTDTTLQGVFNFKAGKIDANKLMGDEEATEETVVEDTTAAPGDPILIPDNLDIKLNAEIAEIKYDELILSNIRGAMAIKNEAISLNDLLFNLLGGTAKMNGSYNTQNHAVPVADFSYDLSNIDISETAKAFTTVEKYAPIAKQASGKISSTMSIKTDLTADFTPVYETMNGRGTLSSDQVVLEGGKFLQKLSETLKSPKLAKQNVQDINATFVIENGKITTDPFDVKIDKMNAVVSGYSSFDATMDYTMAMSIPREELGGEFNKMAEGFLAQANAFLGGSMSLGNNIKVDVRIHGDIADPKISPSFGGMDGAEDLKGQATEAIKEEVKELIDEGKEKAREEAIKQADKILAEAQKQADKLKSEAREAGNKLRSEADKQAKKLIDDASNPLAKQGAKIAGDQLKKQAESSAAKLEGEADKKAEDIMNKARAEADRLKKE